MNYPRIFLFAIITLLTCSCNPSKKTQVTHLPPVTIQPEVSQQKIYHGSTTISHDLVNTWLDVRFDYKKSYLYGKAVITLQPHFYPSDFLWLNARGMEILDVRLINGNDSIKLKYSYSADSLGITLNKIYNKGEQYKIFVDYIAKPDELNDVEGSAAITSDKGLYFINPLGTEPDKPIQIWTQGETTANSVWFPTIDSPNQKMTQEIHMTVDSIYKTLSNGLMINSVNNNDGSRTDTWKQTLPHAPYLVMMAVGDFAVIKDKWRNKEVNYYVEHDYEKVARKIFGNTPEMIEHFSTLLGVDFAWEKYSQIVVRDYVSGAMENTTATLHGEYLQRDDRELLDETNEETVSHELFHHWFGDLVTCESFANIPLNESFATYGEYLWNEYKYGREQADYAHLKDVNNYLRESKSKQVNLIRFYYDNKEDMFDRHSYEKGGCILHMLRKEVGDEAFFAALKKYLETNKFKTVEVHNLRLALEEVTGRDLNWFFNEWFLDKGHPILEMNYSYDAANKKASVTIEQQQDLSKTPLYTLPMQVDVYADNKVTRNKITLTQAKQTFYFNCDTKPELINTDAEKMLLCVKKDNHTKEEWMTMYKKGKLYQDRLEALMGLTEKYNAGTPEANLIITAMQDPFWGIRKFAISKIETIAKSADSSQVRKLLINLAQSDPKSAVRETALSTLGENFKGDDLTLLYIKMTNDSSYDVDGTSLELLGANDEKSALKTAKQFEQTKHYEVRYMLSSLYADYGNDQQGEYMRNAMEQAKGFEIYTMSKTYSKFLLRCENEETITSGLKQIYMSGKTVEPWYVRLAAAQSLAEVGNKFGDKIKAAEKSGDPISATKYTHIRDKASEYLEAMKSGETNEKLLKIYSNGK